jgi:hypothetical protein
MVRGGASSEDLVARFHERRCASIAADMTSAQDNRQRVIRAVDAFNSGDLDTDLPQGPGVLALDPRRVLAVLGHPGVIQHPRRRLDHRAHPLSDRPIKDRAIPRAVGQEMLQRLVLDRPAAQPRDHRLKRLARPGLHQPPRVQRGVTTMLRARQPRRDINEVRRQPVLDLRRHPDQLILDLLLQHVRGNHDSPIRRSAT